MARRPGFTIAEMLVSVAILAVLTAILIPLVSSARAVALRVVCASRLKDLTIACNMHRNEKRAYPVQPGSTYATQATLAPAGFGPPAAPGATSALLPPAAVALPPPKPTDMDPSFLNALSPYLRFPRLEADARADDLPHVVQSPTVEDADDEARESVVEFTFSKPSLYTGYAYCVRPKDGTLLPAVKLLKRERVPGPREDERTVIWADDVHWSASDYAWSFSHARPGARPAQRPLSYFEPRGLFGQHRAFNDGSVEWVDAADIDLEIRGKNNSAATKASLSVSDLYFFWF
jgi:prepilin-type N-terminal cleavage/methylation domain-containing protein